MHRRRPVVVLVIALAMVTTPMAAGAVPASPGDAAPGDRVVSQNATQTTAVDAAPPDPETDVLGWENGYWHNESIDVTRADGLNDTELDAVVARGMARVEYVRGLEFGETPPVEVISREEFKQNSRQEYENLTREDRLLHNIKYEALFMVGEDSSSVAVARENLAGGVGGYYDPRAGEIKIVSNNLTTPKMNEITLSQELFHALQDQQFNISSFNQTTRELHNARDGIIEGDGNYVDRLYQQQCTEGVWEGTCLMPQDQGAPSDFQPHFGLYQIFLQPYSSGPAFVQDIHESEGWEGVNDIYENPPASTEQTIHPDKYGEDVPTNVSVADTSQDPWQRLELNESSPAANQTVPFAQFGEAGLFVALWYPGIESQGQKTVIPISAHINRTASGLSQTEPYLYEHPATAGWDGEKLVPYVTDESAATNETAYVYKLAWDSETDATEFRDKWLELMAYNGAEPVDGHAHTYRVPDGNEFADAFSVTQDGDTVVIVNAPTVEDLSLVREGAAPEVETTPTATEPSGGDGETTPTETPTETATPTTSADGPGFTVIVALVAMLLAGFAAHRQRD